MDPNDGNNESVNDGIFEAVAAANHETYQRNGTPDKASTDPAATGATGGGTPTKQKETTVDPEEEGDNADGKDTQDFSRQPVPSIEEAPDGDTVEPEKTDDTETSTTNPEVDFDWTSGLPEDPGEFDGKAPEPDEFGQIDPIEYTNYMENRLIYRGKVENYNNRLITATFDAVDRILPEVKSSELYQGIIRDTFNGTKSPQQTVERAKQLRAEIDKTAALHKAAGAQNAKTSISIQKNSAVEAKGATKTKSTQTTKSDNLTKRLAKGDTAAHEELMSQWLEEGKV